MKKGILILMLASAFGANAQSLKDALFSGKLKTDTGTVIRKGEDLSTKIDTSTKKPAEPDKAKPVSVVRDSSGTLVTAPVGQGDAGTLPAAAKDNNVILKDNNKIWKDYIDSLTSTLKTEVLTSKKIKSGTYYVLIEYEIGPDGQVAVNNVSPSPESSYLQQQVKERLTLTAPQMNPLLSNNGKSRKIVKKYTLILSKE